MTREQLEKAKDIDHQINIFRDYVHRLEKSNHVEIGKRSTSLFISLDLPAREKYDEGDVNVWERWAMESKDKLAALIEQEIQRLEGELSAL